MVFQWNHTMISLKQQPFPKGEKPSKKQLSQRENQFSLKTDVNL